MTFPNISQYGYQIERELGQNSAGGRITYLATEIKNQQQVVIKQFQFARSQSNWTDYEAYQREIQILQQLNHPSIPRYLESFETDTGFCLVQEYKNAPSLAQPRHWTLAEVKLIAVAILEVLIYLQKQSPPIIHRDIKPENILVDRKGKLTIYLVDFGFASFGNKEVAVSSVVKGTLGFMPPEQIFNRQLTTASDLYSLGMTLICLLTRTKSIEIGNLIDDSYQINFKSLLPKVNPQFIAWLEKMTTPSLKQRYLNATVALAGLLTSKVTLGIPKVTRILVCATPIIVIIIPACIATIELIKSSNSIIKITNQVVKVTTNQIPIFKPEPIKRLLKTRECPGCDLSSADLEYANLQGANLGGANLQGANLRLADLRGANLRSANLQAARLTVTEMQGANITNANLIDAILDSAKLGSANLDSANLRNARLIYANLTGTNLQDANLKNANLQSANLSSADMYGTNLEDADIRFANLKAANLEYANLKKARLGGVNLQTANLTHANLQNADLYKSNIEGSNLESADLRGAIMPNGRINPQ